MKNIRLKAALDWDQIEDRLKYNPEILELHVKEENLYRPEEVVEVIRKVKGKGVKVYLHHPSRFKGQYMDIISSSREVRDYYDWSCKELAAICKQEQVKCVVHCHYAQSESSHFMDRDSRIKVRKRLETILSICGESFLWEDTTQGIFSAENPFLLEEIVKPLQLPLNIDISHAFIALKGDNEKLKHHLDQYSPYAQYYHLVDSNGEYHDALPLGKGKIDWLMVKSYIQNTDFIFEIDLKPSKYLDCTPMIESAKYYNQL
ncbi:TIM barrel protein [Niallia sp. Krafla_26]|uniref:TIM barrel protein n=1 Tax=Niallia sp. Krafla_26 TaxID=3064703 RepID=UPI003D162DEC